MSDDKDDNGVITSILTRKPARPFNERAIRRSTARAYGPGDSIPIRPNEPLNKGLDLNRDLEMDLEMDLRMDELESRIEVLEGKTNTILIVAGVLAVVLALSGLLL